MVHTSQTSSSTIKNRRSNHQASYLEFDEIEFTDNIKPKLVCLSMVTHDVVMTFAGYGEGENFVHLMRQIVTICSAIGTASDTWNETTQR